MPRSQVLLSQLLSRSLWLAPQALIEKVCEEVNARVRPSHEGEAESFSYIAQTKVGEKSKSMQANA